LKIVSNEHWDRDAIWIEGESGVGKTTLANILADSVCDNDFDIEHVKGTDCTIEKVRWIFDTHSLVSFGESGWRVCIVDEAHNMTDRAVEAWLTVLEPLKRNRLYLFTSTEPM